MRTQPVLAAGIPPFGVRDSDSNDRALNIQRRGSPSSRVISPKARKA